MSDWIERLKTTRVVRGLGLLETLVAGTMAVGALSYGGYKLTQDFFLDPVLDATICVNEFTQGCYESNSTLASRLLDAAYNDMNPVRIDAALLISPSYDSRSCAFPFDAGPGTVLEIPIDPDCQDRAFLLFDPVYWKSLAVTRYGGGETRRVSGVFDVGVSGYIWAENQPQLTEAPLFELVLRTPLEE